MSGALKSNGVMRQRHNRGEGAGYGQGNQEALCLVWRKIVFLTIDNETEGFTNNNNL